MTGLCLPTLRPTPTEGSQDRDKPRVSLNNNTAGVRERLDANLAALRQTTFGLIIDALAGA